MSGSGKPSAPSAAAQGRQDPQSAQVVQHLKETKSGKRMAAGLPLELDPDAPTNVYLNHIAPSKPQDKPSPVSAERKADDPAAKSAPVHADAGSDEADRLRKELEVKTKQLVELRDRLKEFQEIANTYGSFKDLALQLATILKASTAAQETIATLNTQQRTLSEAVAAFQKQFMDATKNPVPRPVVVGDGKPEVRVEIKEVVREVVKEVIKEVPVVKEVRVEVVKEVIKEVPVYIKVETAAAPMPEEKKEPPKEPAIPEALKDEAAKPEAAKVESPKEAPKAAEAAKQAEEKKEDKKEEEKKEPVPKLETQKSRTETTRKKIRGQNSNPPSPKKPPRDASDNSPKPGVEKTKSSDRKKHSDSSDVPSPPGSLPASHEGSRIGISQVVPTSPESKEDEERRARHCRESLKELVETERGYVRDLTVLFKTYLQPLQKAQLLTKQDVDAIFPTEDTLMLHTAILAELETALAKPAEQQNVGEVFIKKVDYLKLYTHYCSIQESGTQLLKKLMTDNKKLARALEDARHKPECNKLDLPSYLIKPVQRICKYPLLLREILKNLPPDHKDAKNLQTAHTKVSEIVGLINERSRKAGGGTSGNKVQEILSQISFGATTTFQHRDSRKFVAEARVKMFTPKDGKVWGRQLFVFNDIIVLCRLSTAPGSAKRYKYEETLPFESCLLYDEADRDWEKASGIKNLFRLIRVLDTSSWYFMVKTSDDKKKLMATLRDNMKGAIHDEKLTKLLPDDAVAKAKRMLDGGGSRISRAYMNSPVISSSDRSEKSEKDRVSPRRDKRKSVA